MKTETKEKAGKAQTAAKANKPESKPAGRPASKPNGRLAMIMIRGLINISGDIKATLTDLRLRKKHVCVVVENNPKTRAAASKCKDYITFGEITEDTYNELLQKRGKKDSDGKYLKFFHLHPPRGGFERGGIKASFSQGGVLGNRGAKMDDLVKRML